MELNRKNVKTILLIILFTVALFNVFNNFGAILTAFDYFLSVFGTILVGFGVAVVLNVPLRGFESRVFAGLKNSPNERRRKLVRPLSLICSILVVLAVLALVLIVALPQIGNLFVQLSETVPSLMEDLVVWLEEVFVSLNLSTEMLQNLQIDWEAAIASVTSFFSSGMTGLIDTATSVGGTIVSTTTTMLFGIALGIYILATKERVKAFLARLIEVVLPERHAKTLFHVASVSNDTFSSFVSGQVTEALILGTLCYLGMRIFNFPYAEVISVLVSVFALIPVVGALISGVIGAILILFISPLQAFLFLLFLIILQQLEGAFIYPRVVGKSVGLPGGLVFAAVLLGSNVAGIIGALLSVPVFAIGYQLTVEFVEGREAMRRAQEKSKGKSKIETE